MSAGALEWVRSDATAAVLAGLDVALPGLDGLLDLDAVADRFACDWPVDGAPLTARSVRAQLARITYEPGRRAVAVYRLAVAEPGAPERPTLGVVEITTTGTHHRLAVDDPAMVGLGEAADGAAMADRLAASVTHPVATCAVEPISYRPGAHCVLRYDLQAGPADGGRTVLFGKVYASGMATVAERLTELHRCGRLDGSFEVAGPLDTAPELGLVVQPEAGGQSLGRRVFDPAAPHSRRLDAEAAGRALAGLHRCAGPAGPARALADELEDLRTQVGLVAAADPALARRVDTVLDHLQRVAPAPVTPVPSHGSFRADHVVLHGSRVQLIDLDGYGWSEPARDAGNLLAYLRWRALRDPRWSAAVTEVRSGFLAGYAEVAALDGERCAINEAASAIKIAVRRFRRLAVSEWAAVPELIEAAARLLRGHERVEVR